MSIPDPIADGLARGWKVFGGEHAPLPTRLECDVAIIGSGAGAGITAELLSKAGLKVILVEEGPLRSSQHFKQNELTAYTELYQECGGRKTKDKSITILQGRAVGGTTTVNWTSSFRTPEATLQHWEQHFGLQDYTRKALDPYFEQAQTRLNIHPWEVPPNENNALLRQGASKLGIETHIIPRNVKGCYNLGSCGLGCPTNAKQSMLVTTIPYALDHGATLLVQTRVEKMLIQGGKVEGLRCAAVQLDGAATGTSTTVHARHYVLAAGAINGPALLLRSKAPDPHQRLGARTFLHPVAITTAVMPQRVEPWAGAPQSIYSDHFLYTQGVDGPIGYKLEVTPLHPVFFGANLPGMGPAHTPLLKAFPHVNVMVALLRDGFHPMSEGGRVELRGDGSALLDYPVSDYVLDGARRAMLTMAQIQFEAGATSVTPGHEFGHAATTWAQAKADIQALPMKPLLTRLGSAHVMGGCGMASSPERGVTRPDGVHWQLDNLSVHDGSLFPTSIGANPQLSIYGIVNRLAQQLVQRLGAPAVELA